MGDCVFCGILAGTEPGSFVHRGPRATAFMDIQPVHPGHVLVVPNAHAASLAELDPDDAGHVMRLGQRVAAALRSSGLRCEGVNLWMADGEAAGQDVFHAHLHVVPRFRGDGLRPGLAARDPDLPARDDLDRAAERLRSALD